MLVTLMNKNVPVMQVQMDVRTSYIAEIAKIYNLEYMPVGNFSDANGAISCDKLTAWWSGRAIPASRDGIKEILYAIGITAQELMNKALGLSLSDQYWIKPDTDSIEWQDVNFFQNSFSADVGKAMLNSENKKTDYSKLHLISPDNTSDGWLKKKWIIIDNERYLVKAGSKPFLQEPFNEVVASNLLSCAQDVSYVVYDLFEEAGSYFSKCKNFIDENTEFVPAYYLYSAFPREAGDSELEHLKKSMLKANISDGDRFIDNMLILDYLILNTDRHWGNFGFVRNVETLEFQGPAPLFDNGTSLWHNELRVIKYQEPSKPFHKTHSKQIKQVTSFAAYDTAKIKKCLPDIFAVMKQNPNIDSARYNMLLTGFADRIDELEKIAAKRAK